MLILQSVMAAALPAAAISCPASINDDQRVDLPPGAESVRYYTGPRRLENMTAFVGHPSERRQIRPIESENRHFVWEFPSDQDIWIECTYVGSAAIITFHVGFTRKCSFTKSRGGLDPSIGKCEAPAP